MPLSSHGIIRHCLGELASQHAEYSAQFYKSFFAELPEAEALFSPDRKQQELVLYTVVTMILRGLETGRNLDADLLEFGRRHARLGVREEFFPVFGEVFIQTLIEFLPHWNSEQLGDAWWKAYSHISEVMVAGMQIEYEKIQLEKSVFRAVKGDARRIWR